MLAVTRRTFALLAVVAVAGAAAAHAKKAPVDLTQSAVPPGCTSLKWLTLNLTCGCGNYWVERVHGGSCAQGIQDLVTAKARSADASAYSISFHAAARCEIYVQLFRCPLDPQRYRPNPATVNGWGEFALGSNWTQVKEILNRRGYQVTMTEAANPQSLAPSGTAYLSQPQSDGSRRLVAPGIGVGGLFPAQATNFVATFDSSQTLQTISLYLKATPDVDLERYAIDTVLPELDRKYQRMARDNFALGGVEVLGRWGPGQGNNDLLLLRHVSNGAPSALQLLYRQGAIERPVF